MMPTFKPWYEGSKSMETTHSNNELPWRCNNDSEIELNNILGKNKILYYESNTKRNKMKIYKENKL